MQESNGPINSDCNVLKLYKKRELFNQPVDIFVNGEKVLYTEKNGYVCIERQLKANDMISFILPIEPVFVNCDERIGNNANQTALWSMGLLCTALRKRNNRGGCYVVYLKRKE
jgi:DUF1680 family protein